MEGHVQNLVIGAGFGGHVAAKKGTLVSPTVEEPNKYC
jgi:hypothetical protein